MPGVLHLSQDRAPCLVSDQYIYMHQERPVFGKLACITNNAPNNLSVYQQITF
jgi:hypothetical protein